MSGLFISLEGIEGTGKTTQSRLLAEHLRGLGHTVVETAEPGGTGIGQKIREILLAPDHDHMHHVAELLLYNAARVQHLNEVILPTLRRGETVITDRFSDSTTAYQGYGRGIDLGLISDIDRIATGVLRPDLTILLDIEVQTGLSRNRAANKNDRFEMEEIAFHERVRQGFLRIAADEPGRFRLISCEKGIEQVRRDIIAVVDQFLLSRGGN